MKHQEGIGQEYSKDLIEAAEKVKIFNKLAGWGNPRRGCSSIRFNGADETIGLRVESSDRQLLLETSWVSIYQINPFDLPEHQQKELIEFFEGTVQREFLRLDIQRCKNIAPGHTQFYTELEQLLANNPNSWTYVRRRND